MTRYLLAGTAALAMSAAQAFAGGLAPPIVQPNSLSLVEPTCPVIPSALAQLRGQGYTVEQIAIMGNTVEFRTTSGNVQFECAPGLSLVEEPPRRNPWLGPDNASLPRGNTPAPVETPPVTTPVEGGEEETTPPPVMTPPVTTPPVTTPVNEEEQEQETAPPPVNEEEETTPPPAYEEEEETTPPPAYEEEEETTPPPAYEEEEETTPPPAYEEEEETTPPPANEEEEERCRGNNGFGNGDQCAPGNSGPNNNAENVPGRGDTYPGNSDDNGNNDDPTPDVNNDDSTGPNGRGQTSSDR